MWRKKVFKQLRKWEQQNLQCHEKEKTFDLVIENDHVYWKVHHAPALIYYGHLNGIAVAAPREWFSNTFVPSLSKRELAEFAAYRLQQ
jgi:hypothetical protein